MNLVTINQNNNTLKMTSLQIAEMLGSQHGNVKISIERLIDKGIIRPIALQDVKNNQGQTVRIYEFEGEEGKRDSIIAIAQLSPQHTAILVDRWIELEKQLAAPAPTLPATYLEALKALVNSEEEKVAIQHQLTVAAPKLEYYEQVLDQKELYTISEVAKKNGITAQELNKILLAGGIYDKRSNGKTFKTDFMDKGYGKMITARTGHTQAKLTIKGEVFVTTKAMKSPLAIEILAAREAKKAKNVNKPYKMLDLDQKEARSKHTTNTINSINKLLN